MLVRVIDMAATATEQVVVDWLSSWKGPRAPRGLTTIGLDLGDTEQPRRLDAVIWTPACCVVVEMTELDEKWDGDLKIPRNGPWTVDDVPIGFARTDDRTPLESSRDHTFAMQNWLAGAGLGQRSVRGLVLLMPAGETVPQLQQQWTDPSLAVLLGDGPARLREHVSALVPAPTETWTVNDIATVFHALDMADRLPSPQELLNEGFLGPVDPTLWPTGSFVPPNAHAQTAADPAVDDDSGYVDAYSRARLSYSPWAVYPKTHGEVHFGRAIARITLAFGMLIAFVWLVWFTVNVLLMIGPS